MHAPCTQMIRMIRVCQTPIRPFYLPRGARGVGEGRSFRRHPGRGCNDFLNAIWFVSGLIQFGMVTFVGRVR